MSKIGLILLASISLGLTPPALSSNDGDITLSVNRGVLRPDRYTLHDSVLGERNYICSTQTYLVVENQCISNQQLLNECAFVLAPFGDLNTSKIALRLHLSTNRQKITGKTVNSTEEETIALVVNKSTRLPIDNSICHISNNMEVYRGREQAFEINHDGFTLNDNGAIEIYVEQLVYDIEEYEGELYRMNLSCSGQGLPESGCLFFKVIGSTYITDGKFNCTVPGTRPTNSSKCPLSDTLITETTSSNDQSTSLPLSTTMTTSTLPSSTTSDESLEPSPYQVSGPLFYSVIGVGGGVIVILSLIIVYFVLYVGCRKKCKCTSKDSNNNEDKLEGPKYEEIGAVYQEIIPGAENPSYEEWEKENVTRSEKDDKQGHPPNAYNTLMQVGGLQEHTLCIELATRGTSNEQYSQLHSNH